MTLFSIMYSFHNNGKFYDKSFSFWMRLFELRIWNFLAISWFRCKLFRSFLLIQIQFRIYKDYCYRILKQLLMVLVLARSGTKNNQMVIRVVPSAICNFAMRVFRRVHKYGFWYHVFLEDFYAHEEKMTLRPHVGNCRNFAKKVGKSNKKAMSKKYRRKYLEEGKDE